MKPFASSIAAAALAAILFPLPALSAQSASMKIGLVIQDSCHIAYDRAVSGKVVSKPGVRCDLRHPFRRHLHQELVPRQGQKAAAMVAGDSVRPHWLIEF